MNALVKQATQWSFGIARGGIRLGERLGRRVVSDAFGLAERVRHLRQELKLGMDDVTLARKVESEVFRAADSPEGDVDVNVVDGVVYLHGQVRQPEQIREIETRTRRVPEVIGVENLLHLPGTPAPTRADAPRARRRSGTPRQSGRPRAAQHS
jgi:osmotically-inducible protein OsmY